jgi:phenylacetate-CoA ligase
MKNKILKPGELIRFVRARSPFYRKLYASLPRAARLSDLPVLAQEDFWNANGLEGNRVLTGPMRDGVVFKSGGTTGNPKFSVFSQEEWRVFNIAFGAGIAAGIVAAGDRVVNLFYVGQLYGSFLFINKSFEECPTGVLQLPVSGSTELGETLRIIGDFGADTLAGVPTTIMNLAERAPRGLRIKKILFGGEPMYDDQRRRLRRIWPGVKIHSIGYASTDAGLLGYSDRSCGPGVHRSFGRDTVLEIIDEVTGKPITGENREGLIVVTNLTRTLMPIVRYPVGDRGAWVEPRGTKDRKFRLMGRSEEAARIGLVKLYVADVRAAIERHRSRLKIGDFQLIVIHRARRDGLIARLSSANSPNKLRAFSPRIVADIHRVRPLYEQFVREGKIHPIAIEWVGAGELEVNARSGKLRRVIDRRLDG